MSKIPIRQLAGAKATQDFSTSISIRDLGQLLAGSDMIQELHRHDFFYLLVIKDGKGSHLIDFIPYEICDHTVFFMRPGQVHQLDLQAGSTGFLLQFKKEFYFPTDKESAILLRKVSGTNQYKLTADRFQNLFTILANIFKEYTDRQDRYEEVVKANLNILFIGLSREHPGSFSDAVSLHTQETLEKFLALLEVNIFTHKKASQYAAMLHLTPYQLGAITKAAVGKTVSELIYDQLLLEAKRCLLATASQVNQTAYHLGYEDPSYFIRFFKRHTGYSPAAFRQHFK